MNKFWGLIILIATVPVSATDVCKNNENTFCDVKVISVYDGDTIKVELPNTHPLFAKMSVRIRHIDCAEISARCIKRRQADHSGEWRTRWRHQPCAAGGGDAVQYACGWAAGKGGAYRA